MKTDLEFKIFAREHFTEYDRWFQDDQIKKTLGSIDEDWLDYVLNDDKGIDYAVFQGNEMVGVVGLTYPTSNFKSMVINHIAINPRYFRNGIGSQILKALCALYPLKKEEKWIAYVEKDNHIAQHFFIKNQWQLSESKINERMIPFIFKSPSNKKNAQN